ncbi:MAG: response regulator, partial [Nitrospiraceae bacterium]|nr:response regulator [Nitrospiraceae bacterium]
MNSQTESQKNKYTILIVDDEQANLKLLSALVSCYGYHFETAGNGLEAMEKTKKIRPDLILLDVLMPVMNGVETCKRLKEYPDSRHIPVIVLTSLGDKETRLKCLEAGANDFLAKPVDNAELIVRVRNLLQLKEFEDRNKILTEKIQTIEAVQKIEEELKASQKELIEKNNEMKQLTES